jgi:hypothetical protein
LPDAVYLFHVVVIVKANIMWDHQQFFVDDHS